MRNLFLNFRRASAGARCDDRSFPLRRAEGTHARGRDGPARPRRGSGRGLDAFGLIEHLGIPFEADEGSIVVALNDEVVDLRAPIRDGDKVTIFPPLAGG
jgi:sulfur carrier protein ThiS